jgi:hypothetical protein
VPVLPATSREPCHWVLPVLVTPLPPQNAARSPSLPWCLTPPLPLYRLERGQGHLLTEEERQQGQHEDEWLGQHALQRHEINQLDRMAYIIGQWDWLWVVRPSRNGFRCTLSFIAAAALGPTWTSPTSIAAGDSGDTGLVALGRLGQDVAHPTQKSMDHALELLRYFATFPTASVTHVASDMILRVHTDASYLSERNAGSLSYLIYIL